jgi:hypothetical protein
VVGFCNNNKIAMEEKNDKTANEIEALEAEKNELRLLIGKGISFVVEYYEDKVVRIPRWHFLRWIKRKRKVREEKQKEFVVKEPTAFTLDRLSMEYIELAIDEQRVKEQPRQEARKLFAQHNKRMARIVAIATLGNDWEDAKLLAERTEFFTRWLKNSTLWELVQAIDLTNNLADFINSMRLLSSARTTMPNRIENPEA